MPAAETTQPQAQQMAMPIAAETTTQQPTANEAMTTEPLHLRGGGEGAEICCGLCACFACFECCEACC